MKLIMLMILTFVSGMDSTYLRSNQLL